MKASDFWPETAPPSAATTVARIKLKAVTAIPHGRLPFGGSQAMLSPARPQIPCSWMAATSKRQALLLRSHPGWKIRLLNICRVIPRSVWLPDPDEPAARHYVIYEQLVVRVVRDASRAQFVATITVIL